MSIKPEDVLPDGVDYAIINGKNVRKGSIAAFLANIDILENPNTSQDKKQLAISTMKELAPSVIAIGLHKHVNFKNNVAEKILKEAIVD